MSPYRKQRFGGDRGGSRPGGPRERTFQKFDAICSKCGKPCQVPFRPNGTRPVYCADCFGGPHPISRDRNRPFEQRPSGGTKSLADLERQIGAMNTKIDTMLRILENVVTDADDDADELEEPAGAPPKRAPRSKSRS